MSELLDSVRAANPVPGCEQPSFQGVLSKLEQQEPARRRHVRWQRQVATFVTAAAVAAVVVLIGAALAGGASGRRRAQPSAAVRRLLDGTISCDFGSARGGAPTAVAARGRSAVVYCRGRDRAGRETTFIACQTSPSNVTVYLSDGRPGQCAQLGNRNLPAGYAAAV